MKINEVFLSSDKALFEAVDSDNDSEIATQDLVKVIKTANGPWSKPMTSEEFGAYLDSLAVQNG